MFEYSPVGTILLNEKNKKNYIIIETSYNGDDEYYSTVDVIELDLYNQLDIEFKKSDIEGKITRIEYACKDSEDYVVSDMYYKIEQVYKKGSDLKYV